MSLPVVILAGGLATRLRPLTERIPKALVEVAGRPFLEHQIELLKRNAITEIILCVGYLGEIIQERYGDGEALGVRIRYSFDGTKLLGTGGAIKKASTFLPDAFFVLYGDSYLPVDYQAVAAAFHEAGKPALMTVFANADAWDTSNVWFEDGRIRLYSKRDKLPEMRYIDYGLMVCTRPIFEDSSSDVRFTPEVSKASRCTSGVSNPSRFAPEVSKASRFTSLQAENTEVKRDALLTPEVPFDLAETLEELSRKGQLAGHEVTQRFYEIGSPAGLAELAERLSK